LSHNSAVVSRFGTAAFNSAAASSPFAFGRPGPPLMFCGSTS
jgi:hypothetical protein